MSEVQPQFITQGAVSSALRTPARFSSAGAESSLPTPELRHTSALLRSAKVVCQTGEYICLMRDVCEDGVHLSFLHEAPIEPRIILMLSNGHTHPIQRIWAGERQAGYRFAAPIVLDEFLQERTPFAMRPVRLSVRASARVVDGSQSHLAQLLDLSTHGARFECAAPLAPGREISFQAHAMAPQLGEVIWSDVDRENRQVFGLQFRQPLNLRELAEASLRMQPYGPGPAPDALVEKIPPLGNANAA
ncbi:MAG: PilZ domain-containing protein [Pseudomonadota bacterium]